MNFLVDTNLLLRLVHPGSSFRPQAIQAVRTILNRGDQIVFTPQNAVEFWSVATRPVIANGLNFTPGLADRALLRFDGVFDFLPDNAAIHVEWRKMVLSCNVSGRQVHDARLAAVMRVHGITHLLTFNTADFLRYPGITVVHPQDVTSSP